ncbi:MAG TPA: sigma-70 family RNA polymerase sigma factor [Acidimicrobiales bacterium]|nr:sigma-70 family RNA polymerase sigma factor [Acidimicrobiales bacterium]
MAEMRDRRNVLAATTDADATDALPIAYSRSRDAATRDLALREFDWIATRSARRFDGRGEPMDELTQVARIGLFKALERYSPERGASFAGYAVPTVLGELRRHFRDTTWPVAVGRRSKDLYLAVATARDALSAELGRPPTITELARRLAVSEDDVYTALDAASARYTGSIDAESGAGGRGLAYEAATNDTDHVELRHAMRKVIAILPPRDRAIIDMRYRHDMTQSQIAAELGVSQVQVSRLLSAALRRLRDAIDWR